MKLLTFSKVKPKFLLHLVEFMAHIFEIGQYYNSLVRQTLAREWINFGRCGLGPLAGLVRIDDFGWSWLVPLPKLVTPLIPLNAGVSNRRPARGSNAARQQQEILRFLKKY